MWMPKEQDKWVVPPFIPLKCQEMAFYITCRVVRPSFVCWFIIYNPHQLVRYHPLVNPNVLGPIFTNLVIFVGLQATKIQHWLVVWNMNFIFPFSWEFHHPN